MFFTKKKKLAHSEVAGALDQIQRLKSSIKTDGVGEKASSDSKAMMKAAKTNVEIDRLETQLKATLDEYRNTNSILTPTVKLEGGIPVDIKSKNKDEIDQYQRKMALLALVGPEKTETANFSFLPPVSPKNDDLVVQLFERSSLIERLSAVVNLEKNANSDMKAKNLNPATERINKGNLDFIFKDLVDGFHKLQKEYITYKQSSNSKERVLHLGEMKDILYNTILPSCEDIDNITGVKMGSAESLRGAVIKAAVLVEAEERKLQSTIKP